MKFSKQSSPIKGAIILEYFASTLENIGIVFASFSYFASLHAILNSR